MGLGAGFVSNGVFNGLTMVSRSGATKKPRTPENLGGYGSWSGLAPGSSCFTKFYDTLESTYQWIIDPWNPGCRNINPGCASIWSIDLLSAFPEDDQVPA